MKYFRSRFKQSKKPLKIDLLLIRCYSTSVTALGFKAFKAFETSFSVRESASGGCFSSTWALRRCEDKRAFRASEATLGGFLSPNPTRQHRSLGGGGDLDVGALKSASPCCEVVSAWFLPVTLPYSQNCNGLATVEVFLPPHWNVW